jgi:hypothetical protein
MTPESPSIKNKAGFVESATEFKFCPKTEPEMAKKYPLTIVSLQYLKDVQLYKVSPPSLFKLCICHRLPNDSLDIFEYNIHVNFKQIRAPSTSFISSLNAHLVAGSMALLPPKNSTKNLLGLDQEQQKTTDQTDELVGKLAQHISITDRLDRLETLTMKTNTLLEEIRLMNLQIDLKLSNLLQQQKN